MEKKGKEREREIGGREGERGREREIGEREREGVGEKSKKKQGQRPEIETVRAERCREVITKRR
jgi:hypothetical protein